MGFRENSIGYHMGWVAPLGRERGSHTSVHTRVSSGLRCTWGVVKVLEFVQPHIELYAKVEGRGLDLATAQPKG